MSFDKIIDRSNTGSLKWDKYKDTDIMPMWVADMDFHSPDCVIKALEERVKHGVFGYTIPYDSVIETVIAYAKRRYGVSFKREWLVWLPGLVPALNTAARAFAAEGEEVMTCTPVYPPFLSAPTNANRILNAVDLKVENGIYTFDFDAMEKAVNKNTKLFFLCNPHNPVGRVYRRDELEKLADFCERHDLVLISDEIHCDLLLEDELEHISINRLGESVSKRSITLMAPSKTYNLPGLACSVAVIPDEKLRMKFERARNGMITEVNAFGYAGCEAAFKEGESWLSELIPYLRENRDYLSTFVKDRLDGIEMVEPMEATYLAWLNPKALKLKDPIGFFEKAGVGLSEGSFFGASGWIRFNIACPKEKLEKALLRMEEALKSL